MSILNENGDWKVLIGDSLETLRTFPDDSVDLCVTSPPYYRLRDYGVDGQVGLEEKMSCGARCGDCYICKLVAIFAEVRRVLKPSGTCWVNIGDTYAAKRGYQVPDGKSKDVGNGLPGILPDGLKQKDLCLIPQRLAIALQADGWYVRSEVIWHKLNGMPSSVKDRPTYAHEQVWMLAKSETYYYDYMAIAEDAVYAEQHAKKASSWGTDRKHPNKGNVEQYAHRGENHTSLPGGKKNKRSVWSLASTPSDVPHFAPFPTTLVSPIIRVGCPVGGIVLDPFTGSGTAGMVARKEGRRFVGIELNPEYAAIARKRISGASLVLEGFDL